MENVTYIYRQSADSAMSDLRGLEQGYRSLYQKVRMQKVASRWDLAVQKFKITRIMMLSHFKRRAYGAAFESLLKGASM